MKPDIIVESYMTRCMVDGSSLNGVWLNDPVLYVFHCKFNATGSPVVFGKAKNSSHRILFRFRYRRHVFRFHVGLAYVYDYVQLIIIVQCGIVISHSSEFSSDLLMEH